MLSLRATTNSLNFSPGLGGAVVGMGVIGAAVVAMGVVTVAFLAVVTLGGVVAVYPEDLSTTNKSKTTTTAITTVDVLIFIYIVQILLFDDTFFQVDWFLFNLSHWTSRNRESAHYSSSRERLKLVYYVLSRD